MLCDVQRSLLRDGQPSLLRDGQPLSSRDDLLWLHPPRGALLKREPLLCSSFCAALQLCLPTADPEMLWWGQRVQYLSLVELLWRQGLDRLGQWLCRCPELRRRSLLVHL